eukprot:TRINITY_DN439_c0_g1_i1.p1 TRINITY_DN439_c0_g1~~TRINITY_DN439_c0_g1_i1.p1  ORF type:complete len:524 (+),score=198.18 TRINITY_DN439_c0_g1_i1:75-1646(+)
MVLYLLFESASGYGLFERTEGEDIASQTEQFQASITDPRKFKQLVSLKAFLPFTSAENALENINDVSEGVLNDSLKNFLTAQLPKEKKSKNILGVSEDKLGSVIQETIGIKCEKSTNVLELLRGIRVHFESMIKGLKEGDLEKAQRGLGHSYSRSKVKFNVNRADNMIIQSISLLDQLDKDLNTFAMRCKEWYSWHFPELIRVVPDQKQFARLVKLIRNKDNISEDDLPAIEEVTGSAEVAQEVLDAARTSMGTDISEIDLTNIESFADRVISLAQYRDELHEYLLSKMNNIAPNLSALMGEQVGARLISHAGSLTNLAKFSASTVQILGAEKALFRALKTKGNTPKYGLIFHSSFIGKAGTKNKGRIARCLANKASIAARIDSFSDVPTSKFGEVLKEQVEERLRFYDSGVKPRKNVDVMHEALEEAKKDGFGEEPKKRTPKKKTKKARQEEMEVEEQPQEVETPKKKKKRTKEPEPEPEVEEAPKKTPKKAKKVDGEEEAPKSAKKTPRKTPKKQAAEEDE